MLNNDDPLPDSSAIESQIHSVPQETDLYDDDDDLLDKDEWKEDIAEEDQDPWMDCSEEYNDDDVNSDSGCSASGREDAVREGFQGWLEDYFKNDMFQRFMEMIGPIIMPIYKFAKEIFNRVMNAISNQDSFGDGFVDPGLNPLTSGGPIPGPGVPVGPPPGVAEMAASAVSLSLYKPSALVWKH